MVDETGSPDNFLGYAFDVTSWPMYLLGDAANKVGVFNCGSGLILQNKISDNALDQGVKQSLNEHIDNGPHPDWTVDCDYKDAYVKYGIDGKVDVYTMASCSLDYHTKDDQGKPIIGGVGVPVHLQLQNENGKYKLITFEQASDANYSEDLQRIFPKEYLNSIKH